MSKNLNVENLADNAIDEKSEPIVSDEKLSVAEKVEAHISSYEDSVKTFSEMKPIMVSIGKRRRLPPSLDPSQFEDFINPVIDFPLSVTDQTHALSISEQVRRGIAQEQEPDESSFDFKDGKDDGSEAIGIFELSNRVDAWIAEQNLSDDLRTSFRSQVLQKQADKAMKETLDKSTNKQTVETKKTVENLSEPSK